MALHPSPTPGQEPEPLIETGRDLRRLHRRDPGRGQLDGQRDPVQTTTDLRHRPGRARIEHEAAAAPPGPARRTSAPPRCPRPLPAWAPPPPVAATAPAATARRAPPAPPGWWPAPRPPDTRAPARPPAPAAASKRCSQLSNTTSSCLVRRSSTTTRPSACGPDAAHPQRRRDHLDHLVGDRRSDANSTSHAPSPNRGNASAATCNARRVLPDPTHPGQRHHPGRAQRHRQPPPAPPRGPQTMSAATAGSPETSPATATARTPDPAPTWKTRSGRDKSRSRCSPRSTSSTPLATSRATSPPSPATPHLAAVADRHQPRRPVHRRAEVVPVALLRLARMQPHPHPQRPRPAHGSAPSPNWRFTAAAIASRAEPNTAAPVHPSTNTYPP